MWRIKGAISLLSQNDERVKDYDDEKLVKVLSDNCYHSLEESATDADVDKPTRIVKEKFMFMTCLGVPMRFVNLF